MDWIKYSKIPTEYATASVIGLAAATLTAMERRGFVESLPTKPKQYRRVNTPQALIYKHIYENEDDFGEFFTLYRVNEKIGMLCSINKSGDILDCWGKKYDLANINRITFRTRSFTFEA